MRIKRFRAPDLPSVVKLIKEEFGLAAVILSQRDNPETGEVEVTAGVREEDLARNPPEGSPPEALGPPPVPAAGKGGLPKKAPAGEAFRESPAAAPSAASGGPAPPIAAAAAGISPDARPGLGPPRPAPRAAGGPLSDGGLEAAGVRGPRTDLAARDLRPARAAVPAAPAAGLKAYRETERPSGPSLALESEFADFRREVEDGLAELKNMLLDLAHRQSLAEKWRGQEGLARLYRVLLETGLFPEHARDFVEMAAESREAWGGELLEQLRQTVRPLVKCLPPKGTIPRVLAVTGPSGAGKTATVMKLASLLKQEGKKTALISLDTLKLGAAEELAQFARISGLGLKVAQSRGEYLEAAELFQGAENVLVDTSTRDFSSGGKRGNLTRALAESGALNLLALPASLKTEDLLASHQAASGPLLWGVCLTKLDETANLGNVFNFIKASGPVFAYFSKGHKSPDDFLPAGAGRLVDMWLENAGLKT
ncbi:MAG: hypothetical protein LBR53_02530 [Deltaproteobacteria bacterium]|jgi:flagellar biosynthesis GTPase FlhF|nr:hypothetical protein [Deltaproteobacteria bacterium]